MNTAMMAYPWDLDDEGIDSAMARMAGDIGVNAVTIGAVLPEVRAVRRRNIAGSRVIERPAGAHFQPDARFYSAARLRPAVSAWMRQRNPLSRIAESAAENRLALRLRVSCCDMPTLVERHPMAGTVNVYGEPQRRWLCPSNPDVRAYLVAVVQDLCANYQPVAIELDAIGFENRAARYFEWSERTDTTALESYLLGLCFCPACRERAERLGANPERAASEVQSRLEQEFNLSNSEDDRNPVSVIQQCASIAAYERMRSDAVLSLLAQIREHSSAKLVLDCESSGLAAHDVTSAAKTVDSFLMSESMQNKLIPNGPSQWMEALDDASRLELRIQAAPPRVRDAQQFVRLVKAVADRGFGAVEFSHYGSMPEPALDWIRQALRYMKREHSA